ncbi:MAG: hypothetical protein LLG44_01110 [Chloroflexi bacterium]|nr:hypothetical protein [Chloroflexota bacterium]
MPPNWAASPPAPHGHSSSNRGFLPGSYGYVCLGEDYAIAPLNASQRNALSWRSFTGYNMDGAERQSAPAGGRGPRITWRRQVELPSSAVQALPLLCLLAETVLRRKEWL